MVDMSGDRTAALLRLFDETTALYHELRSLAAEVHGQGELSAGRRGVLRSLDRLGPQTVPQLARARNVSRQHVQVLMNRLLDEGLAAAEENPAHLRSPLMHLTQKGRHLLTAMQGRERDVLARARVGISIRELEHAAGTLGALRRYLESPEWRHNVAEHDGQS